MANFANFAKERQIRLAELAREERVRLAEVGCDVRKLEMEKELRLAEIEVEGRACHRGRGGCERDSRGHRNGDCCET